MFRRLNDFLRPAAPAESDAGFSLVEVIVAMMVFAVISVGVAYSITNALVLTRESQSRAVATNLAAQDIDLMRSLGDIADVKSATLDPVTVNGTTYTVTRSVKWVAAGDASLSDSCGVPLTAAASGTTAALQYKSVSVAVSYAGRRGGTLPVTSDTIIAPKSRLNEVDKGTIIVSVTGAQGAGVPGVAATVAAGSPSGGAVTPSAQPAPTSVEGCTFAYKVTPGTYTVSVTKAGFVSNAQAASPSTTVTVAGGASATAKFTLDAGVLYGVAYAAGYVPPAGQPAPVLPTDLKTTLSGSGVETTFPAIPVTGLRGSVRLFPAASGYNAVAGLSGPNCLALDPANWTTPVVGATPGAPPAGAVGRASEAAVPPADIQVPLGVVTVTGLGRGTIVKAAMQTAGSSGAPGCATTPALVLTYPASTGASQTLALPYGSWVLSSSTGQLPAAAVTLMTPGSKPAGNVVVVDPRQVTP